MRCQHKTRVDWKAMKLGEVTLDIIYWKSNHSRGKSWKHIKLKIRGVSRFLNEVFWYVCLVPKHTWELLYITSWGSEVPDRTDAGSESRQHQSPVDPWALIGWQWIKKRMGRRKKRTLHPASGGDVCLLPPAAQRKAVQKEGGNRR